MQCMHFVGQAKDDEGMAIQDPVLRLLLVAQLLTLALAAVPAAAAVAAPTTAEPSSVFLVMRHEESSMTSITVSWSENSTYSEEDAATTPGPPVYHVEALNLLTGVRMVSPALSSNESEYTMPDLAVDTEYELCVVSSGVAAPACALLSTIPIVRDDSLIALFIALAVLAAIILIAVILRRCAMRRARSADDDAASDDKPDVDDDDKHGALNEKSPLLVPASAAETLQAGPPPPPAEPPAAATQPDTGKQEQPQSLYLFLAGHAFK